MYPNSLFQNSDCLFWTPLATFHEFNLHLVSQNIYTFLDLPTSLKMSTSCVICNGTEESLTKVTPKGIKTLVESCRKRNAEEIEKAIASATETNALIFVHITCRKSFTDKRKFQNIVNEKGKETRSTSEKFKFITNCLFCNEQCIADSKNPSRKPWIQASTHSRMSFKQCQQMISRSFNQP